MTGRCPRCDKELPEDGVCPDCKTPVVLEDMEGAYPVMDQDDLDEFDRRRAAKQRMAEGRRRAKAAESGVQYV